MGKKINELGNKYNKLLVIEEAPTLVLDCGQKRAQWKVLCDCGTEKVVQASPLRRGMIKSCGCLREEVVDWAGTVQGNVEVLSRAEDHSTNSRAKIAMWNCKCTACGNDFTVSSSGLRQGRSSCGCINNKTRHGHAVGNKHSPTYVSWHAMMERCYRETKDEYKTYGAIGIYVEESWHEFDNFLADMGERPKGTSLNRIAGSMVYSKDTCEWASLSVQAFDQKIRCTNTSGRTGVTLSKCGTKWYSVIWKDYKRINLGTFSNFEDAVKAREEGEIKYYGWTKQ